MERNLKILLIDDEPEILDLLRMMLKTEGYDVSTSRCGKEALNKLEKASYDAVVCDYLMPLMDGITLLKQVRNNKDYTPFVFFSGDAHETHQIKMKNLGAYEFIEKPHVELLAGVLAKTIKHNESVKILNPELDEKDEFANILFSSCG